MKLLALSCNHCGAPIEAPAKAKFLTCRYCNSRLAVKQSDGAYYTELLETLDQRTKDIAEDIEALRVQNQILQLDNEWTQDRDTYMSTDQRGRRSVPSKAGAIMMGVFMPVVGVIWMVFTVGMGAPGFFPCFGIIFIAAGIGSAIWMFTRAQRYEDAHDDYMTRRSKLMGDLRKHED